MTSNTAMKSAVLVVLLISPAIAFAASSKITIKATSQLPRQTEFTQQFLNFVKKVNDNKNIGVKINYIGGPEAIPQKRQGEAVENGTVGMIYGPSNYLVSEVPASYTVMGSTITAPEARANGGMKLLNSIYEKRMNVHLLGWFGSNKKFFHIYLEHKPQFNSSGEFKNNPKVRSVQMYRGVLDGMGASPQRIGAGDVYTALQRGVVNGVVWPLIGITDLGWQKYLKYRIKPGFYTNSTIVLVNLDVWKKMSQHQRNGLQKAAKKFEKWSIKDFNKEQQQLRKKTAKLGMKTIKLQGASLEKYEKLAKKMPWQDMKRFGGTHIKELKKYFMPESK